MGTLYLVATPIGNLDDISARGLRVLNEVGLIAAEDTRQTRKLLDHYQIRTRLLSYHEHNKLTRLGEVLAALDSGDVALVSDAGTPALNDPGYELVRATLAVGFPVSPIPGPCAPVAALVASGLPTNSFLYLGYLPRRRSGRLSLLEDVSRLPYTLIFLEAPHRLRQALLDMKVILGDREIAVARELTKMYEEIIRGKLSATIQLFDEHQPRGEFTLVVAGYQPANESWSEEKLENEMRKRLAIGEPPAQIASQLAAQAGWSRRDAYRVLKSIKIP